MAEQPAPGNQGDIYDRIIATAERRAVREHQLDQAANLCERAGQHIRYMSKPTCECGEEP